MCHFLDHPLSLFLKAVNCIGSHPALSFWSLQEFFLMISRHANLAMMVLLATMVCQACTNCNSTTLSAADYDHSLTTGSINFLFWGTPETVQQPSSISRAIIYSCWAASGSIGDKLYRPALGTQHNQEHLRRFGTRSTLKEVLWSIDH